MTAQRAMNLVGATAANVGSDRPAAILARWTAGTLVGLLFAVAVLVLSRRLAGALSTALDTASLSAVGVTRAVMAGAARRLWRVAAPRLGPSAADGVVAVLPSLMLAACGGALCLPGTPGVGLVIFWGLLIGEELWAWRRIAGEKVRRKRPPVQQIPQPEQEPEPVAASPDEPPSQPLPPPAASAVPGQDVLQQLTRSQTAEGVEQLSGWLRTPFSVGQRTASVHVAFCPPFPKTPQLEVEQLDGPPSRIKTAQLLPHGTRLDLKLTRAAEMPMAVLLQFSARNSGQ